MTTEFIPIANNQDPSFTELHTDLANARIDYIDRGGKSRLSLVQDATGPYVDALNEILDQLPAYTAQDMQYREATARISALGIEHAPAASRTAVKGMAYMIGSGVVGGIYSGLTGSEVEGSVISATGFGYGLSKIFLAQDARHDRPISAILANTNTILNISYNKSTEQILSDENSTVISDLRKKRKSEKAEVAVGTSVIAAGALAGRLILHRYV